MLTKEAFNALLKTLEEPPKATLFFFATTEPQKLPTTILSRCQRFDLIKLTPCEIEEKLNSILKELKIEAEKDALALIAKRAKGALRDAESLLEQVITFHCQKVTLKAVEQAFGLVPAELFFKLDQAVEKGDTAFAFGLAKELFDAGIALSTYLELFSEHLRTLLMIRLSSKVENLDFIAQIKEYQASAKIYTDDQLIYLIDLILEWQQKKQLTASERTVIEAIHLKVIKSRFYISPQMLLERLAALEKSLGHIKEEKNIAAPIVEEQEKPKEIEAISISSAPPSSRTETLLQFISVELEGKIQR
jgi:DNA polymerase III subunit gamma/tau